MTKTTKKAPATAATVTDAKTHVQPHDTTDIRKLQDIFNDLSNRIFSEVRSPLRAAHVVLNDQGNDFFTMSTPEASDNLEMLAYGYEHASIRNELAFGKLMEALDAVDAIINSLDDVTDYIKGENQT